MALHELALERRNLHGHFSRDLEPVLTVDSGDSVSIEVPSSGWRLENGEPFEPRDAELDSGHALAGPIEVRGARAGQTLWVRVDEVQTGSWGMTFTRDDHVVRWELSDGVARSERFTVTTRPVFDTEASSASSSSGFSVRMSRISTEACPSSASAACSASGTIEP